MKMHEYPVGWLDVLVESVIRHNLNCPIEDLTDEDQLTNALLERSGGSTSMKDHWGDSNGTLVFEPYGNYDASARIFANYLNVQLVTGNPPAWNSTCRRYEFIIREVTPVAKSFAELIRCVNWEFRERCKALNEFRSMQSAIRSVCKN